MQIKKKWRVFWFFTTGWGVGGGKYILSLHTYFIFSRFLCLQLQISRNITYFRGFYDNIWGQGNGTQEGVFMRAFFKYFNVILFIIGVLETTETIHKQLKLFFLKTPLVLLVFLTALRIYIEWSLILFTYGGTFFNFFFLNFLSFPIWHLKKILRSFKDFVTIYG